MANLSIESQLKKIEKQLQSKIQDALNNEVKEVVVETLLSHVKTDIYDYYTPKIYERKYDDGGLADEANIKTSVKGNTLSVENVRKDGSKNVAEIVETGEGYTYGEPAYSNPPYSYQNPRPFTENTRVELRETGKHVDALKKGLKRNNVNIV